MCDGYGDPHADVLFIGISAGRLGALKTWVPFTRDASGRLMQRYLYATGFSRTRDDKTSEPNLQGAWLTNFVKGQCLTAKGLNRLPTHAEFEFWWPSLYDEIQLVQPKAILALGNLVYTKLLHFAGGTSFLTSFRVRGVNHPRWYTSHGALSEGSPWFSHMVQEYNNATRSTAD